MALIALLSNPRSTGNRSMLPRVRDFVAAHPNIFHYEVENVSEVPVALRMIARVKPAVLVINGGDGTVQAALTELYQSGHYGGEVGAVPPPVAVIPNGKTNLIALDLGAVGDPIAALEQILRIVADDLSPHVVARQLIALTNGGPERPVLGMFLGGAGLADLILFCRHKVYPLGLPNWISHVLAGIAMFVSVLFGLRGTWLPARPGEMRVSVNRGGHMEGRFFLLMVTTLERLLLNGRGVAAEQGGPLKVMAIEQRRGTVVRAALDAIRGRLGEARFQSLHIRQGDEIRIEADHASVVLDGETFHSSKGRPIILTPTAPVRFLSLAA